MDIILAHDSFTQLGGAEKVVDTLHEMFSESPIFTLVMDKKLKEKYIDWDIRTSWLQDVYNLYPHFQFLLPLIPIAIHSLNLEVKFKAPDGEMSVLFSSSSGFIKAIKKPKNSVHINYCHTPTRFLWTDTNYVNQEVPEVLRPLAKIYLSWMKKWDYKKAQKVDFFIANSAEVKKRMKKYYNKDSVVIYPGVDTQFWKPTKQKGDYFLLAGRLQSHKKNDLIVEIFNELGLPLHVVGTGRQEGYLKSIAKSNVTFLGRISDNNLRDEYSGALAYVFPQIEDFGLMPLEAASCGTATIGIAAGGSLETILPGQTGELFESYDKEKIKQIILSWQPQKYKTDIMHVHAEKFSKQKFEIRILEFINNAMK